MNSIRPWIYSSNRWKRPRAKEVFPPVFDKADLGKNALETGPGPD